MNFQDLQTYIDKRQALNQALTLFSWDQETEAPEKSMALTAKSVGLLSGELFKTITDPKVKEILLELEKQELTISQKAIVKKWLKDIRDLEKIPAQKYQEHQERLMIAQRVWQKAKLENNYQLFMPYLKEIVVTEKEFAQYRKTNEACLYDVVLEDYEPGFHVEELDEFFNQLKEHIVPLLKEIQASPIKIDKEYNYKHYSLNKQKEFNRWLAGYVGFDFKKGVIKESEHPFTTEFHNHDVRITTHYYENNLESALFSTIHESGHAIYEMNIDDDITMTPVGSGASMGMHESQSRFYENIIGRSEEFWKPVYPRLQTFFADNLEEVSLEQFVQGINKVEASLIRTEADELTYPLHIMIRYELEKKMFAGEVDFEKLPQLWNQLYQEYLGITPQNDSEGILQDIHWAGGSFGYFPSYALGSAIAAQIYAHMQKTTAVADWVESGDFQVLKKYLQEYIHQYGAIYQTNELLEKLTGEKFNPKYYIEYLTNKFTKLYHLR